MYADCIVQIVCEDCDTKIVMPWLNLRVTQMLQYLISYKSEKLHFETLFQLIAL